MAIVTSFLNIISFLQWLENISNFEGYIIFFAIMLPYYTFFESKSQQTIGKYITKTMVVTEDGSKPDIGTAFRRTLCRLIPFDAFSFLGSYSRGWHDSISDTYMVKKELHEKQKELFYSFEEIGQTSEE